jgi:hypothetical protein
MSWDGVERRKDQGELDARFSHISRSLQEITKRLDDIDRSINKVEGAWLFAKYVIAVPVALWAFYEWFKDHVIR